MFHDDLRPDTFHSPSKYFTNPLYSFSDMRKSYSFAVQVRYILQNSLNCPFCALVTLIDYRGHSFAYAAQLADICIRRRRPKGAWGHID